MCRSLPQTGWVSLCAEGAPQHQSQLAAALAGEPRGTRHSQRHMRFTQMFVTSVCSCHGLVSPLWLKYWLLGVMNGWNRNTNRTSDTCKTWRDDVQHFFSLFTWLLHKWLQCHLTYIKHKIQLNVRTLITYKSAVVVVLSIFTTHSCSNVSVLCFDGPNMM